MGGLYFTIELLLAEGLFAFFIPKRPKIILRYLLCAAVTLAVAYFLPTAPNKALFICEITFFFVLTVALQVVCLKTTIWNYVYICVAGYTVQHLSQQPKNLLMLLYPYLGGGITRSLFERLMVLLCVCVVYFVVFLVFAKKLRTKALDMDRKRFIIVATIILFFSVILSGSITPASDADYIVQKLYAAACCLLSMFLLYSLVAEKKLEKELETVRQIQHEEKEHYMLSKETIEMINLKCHDLKHQISSIRISGEIINPAVLKDIENAVSIYDSVLKTGNEALDVILTEKSLFCEKNKITLSCIIDGERLSFMKDADIYSLFGNALDNAIEAVMSLPDPDDRRIGVQIKCKNNLLTVHVQNKYSGDVAFDTGLPVTTKEDKNYHGFGVKSMKMIVEMYNGVMKIKTQNNIFCLDMLFPLEKTAQDANKDNVAIGA